MSNLREGLLGKKSRSLSGGHKEAGQMNDGVNLGAELQTFAEKRGEGLSLLIKKCQGFR